jgi:hypothetical protein
MAETWVQTEIRVDEADARTTATNWSTRSIGSGQPTVDWCVVQVGDNYEVLKVSTVEHFPLLKANVIAVYHQGIEVQWPISRT